MVDSNEWKKSYEFHGWITQGMIIFLSIFEPKLVQSPGRRKLSHCLVPKLAREIVAEKVAVSLTNQSIICVCMPCISVLLDEHTVVIANLLYGR